MDGSLYPNHTVITADAVSVPDAVLSHTRKAAGQAVTETLIAPQNLNKYLTRSAAAAICRRLHI